jgi:hypothetical protein
VVGDGPISRRVRIGGTASSGRKITSFQLRDPARLSTSLTFGPHVIDAISSAGIALAEGRSSIPGSEAQTREDEDDPHFVAKARELRDRWLEHVNADPSGLIGAGKYEVARRLPEATPRAAKLLEAA